MNPKHDAYLVKKCPTLFADRFACPKTTAMCWGFECGDGWYSLLKKTCLKLEPIMAAAKAKDPDGWNLGLYRAAQVKEKFGSLRFYLTCYPERVDEIIREAEMESASTCEKCGKPGKLRGKIWLYTACDRHTNKPL